MNKYPKRKPNRLTDYDYSKNGYYYVTICTQNHECIFGNIIHNRMILNQSGEIARNSWIDLPNHHKDIELEQKIK